MTTVKEIVIAELKEMGADGLCCPSECGCGLDDLMPCFDGSCSVCVPAKEVPVPDELQGDCDRYFEPMTDEEIEAAIKESRHNIFVESLSHTQQIPDSTIGTDHCHSLEDGQSNKMRGDEDEPQEPPEVRP